MSQPTPITTLPQYPMPLRLVNANGTIAAGSAAQEVVREQTNLLRTSLATVAVLGQPPSSASF